MERAAVHALLAGLPGAEEYDHGGLPAFRVRGRRYASMLDATGMNLMLDEAGAREATALWPDSCTVAWFGRMLTGVHVEFAAMADDDVAELVEAAYRRKAPATLRRELDERG
ncbi:hypothetical protein AGMMS50218_05130 [Actinomycetota bacterium]|nr:hypothetical protein AGMMS50218_05130 [Actinomycetota bacterium]